MRKNLCFVILLLSFSTTAQYARITYPINRSVFQQKVNDVTPISLAFQIDALRFSQDNGLSGGIPIYKVEQLDLQTGLTVIGTPRAWTGISVNSTLINNLSLSKGWYKVTLGVYFSDPAANFVSELSSVKFGVGDVYFVAGQSNASGFDETTFDNVQNYAQTYPSTEQYDAVSFIKSPQIIDSNPFTYGGVNTLGLPFNPQVSDTEISAVISNLTNGVETDKNKMYPNGRGSWYWSQFAHRMAKDKDTPVMIFNIATPNTSTQNWAANFNTNLYKQFRRILQTYGNIFGAKAVLWHQGENDTGGYHYAQRSHTIQNNINLPNYDPDGPTYLSNFKLFLQNLIAYSRGDFSANLPWYISTVSYTNYGNFPQNGFAPFDPLLEPLICGSSDPINLGIYKKMKSGSIKAQQTSLFSSNIFPGVTTADNITECDRASKIRVHFTGEGTNLSLQTMGNWWYDAVNTNYPSTTIEGKTLLPITSSRDGNNNFVLNGPLKAGNQPYAKYFWVKNGNGVFDASKVLSTQINFSTNVNFTSLPDFYVCYVSDDTDVSTFKVRACQPFVIPNSTDLQSSLRITNGSQNISQVSFSANNDVKGVTVSSSNLVWDAADVPSWASLSTNSGGFQDTQVNITTQANNSGNPRSATIRVKQYSTINDFEQTLLLYQASTSCSEVNLSSLSPVNPSNEWQGLGTLQTNKSVDGNIMKIGGQTFINGLGTHANSTIKYNLGGQFLTFHASIGRDDETDGCTQCGVGQTVIFKVKVDGNLIFTSPNMGVSTPVQEINLNITGKNQLELIVEDGDDFSYGDHADWADAKLLCTAIPCGNYLSLASPADDISGSTTKRAVISISATNKVNSSANVEYKAGNSIVLQAGFSVVNGAIFKATIPSDPCNN